MNKDKEKLDSFIDYCITHPEQRFWQASRNWSDYNFILGADSIDFIDGKFIGIEDTFYKK